MVIIITSQVEKLSTKDIEKYLFKFINNSEKINESNDINNTIDINEGDDKENINLNSQEDKDNKIKIKSEGENNELKNNKYVNKYFLSEFIINFKKIKNIFLFIFITSIIQLSLFLYRVKFWIYFTPKEKALPISTVQNTKFYIASVICKYCANNWWLYKWNEKTY